MTPLVGLSLFGNHLAPTHPHEPGAGTLGAPCWSRGALLADLELRLGLPSVEAPHAVRVAQWQMRMATLDNGSRFYSQSFAADPTGTSAVVLALRDELVEAGWGGVAPGGSKRLGTLAALEADSAELPPGRADRLQAVCAALKQQRSLLYESLRLLEARDLWPGLWQRAFALLEGLGTAVSEHCEVWPDLAPAESDLGKLQRLTNEGAVSDTPTLTGDGSLLLLTASTPFELSDAVAAIAARKPNDLCVIRAGNVEVLDAALRRQGLASQGSAGQSERRPLLQVVPLLVQLSFAARDPEQLLQLLTLPRGPFANRAGRTLVEALSEAPGMKSPGWIAALGEYMDQLEPFVAVLDGPGLPVSGAPKAVVLEIIDSGLAWFSKRLGDDDPLFRIAYTQAKTLRAAVEQHAASELDFLTCQQLCAEATEVANGVQHPEQSGRIAHVDSPALLFVSHQRVVFWNCVGDPRVQASPWRGAELEALASAGVRIPPRSALLAERARGYRRAVLAARVQLILAVPRQRLRERNRTHPLLDELQARLRASTAQLRQIEVDAEQLRTRKTADDRLVADTSVVDPLALPEARRSWILPKGLLTQRESVSASSLQKLLGCPLSWTLAYQAKLRAGGPSQLASGPVLNGNLGHHLIQRLHAQGMFDATPAELSEAAETTFDQLVEEEAMVLLTDGKGLELQELRSQLVTASCDLAKLLLDNQLTLVAVEHPVEATWQGHQLSGSIDCLLRRVNGEEVVLDLKWGSTYYGRLLKTGAALQLAVYSAARQLETGAALMPPAGYYSLRAARLMVTDAAPVFGMPVRDDASVAETWQRAEPTIRLIEDKLEQGQVAVAGAEEERPLLSVLGQNATARAKLLEFEQESACKYCEFDAVCGKAWRDWQ